MRDLGFFMIGDQIHCVLYEDKKTSRLLKIRKPGWLGTLLSDEGHYLKEHKDVLDKLLSGKTIEL